MEAFKTYLLQHYRYHATTLERKIKDLQSWQQLCSKHRPLEKLKAPQLLQLTALQQQQCNAQVLNARLLVLEQYYFFLLKSGAIQKHPLKDFRVKMPKPPLLQGFLKEEELHNIYLNYPVKGHWGGQFDLYSQRNKVILGLLIYQALTENCLEHLQASDIDLKRGIITIAANSESKLQTRILPLEGAQILDLQTYLQQTRPQLQTLLHLTQSPLLFPRSAVTRMSINLISIKKKIKSYADINSLKQLRNSRIQLWLQQYNIRQAQYKTGFKKLQGLERYQQHELLSLKQAIDKYHPL